MSRAEDEITRQLHLCVALMSDPLIMLEQSKVVADHFVSALHKIEMLQEFLRPPDDPCARHNWLDSTVILKGVRRMVVLVLNKHMEPLRWSTPKQIRAASGRNDNFVKTQLNAAPQIFERKFSKDGRFNQCDETLIAREIKETNCMASLVLLYYYLNWHILLIMLNYRIHPCIGGRESEADQRLNIERLLKGLPNFVDMFELRPIHGMWKLAVNQEKSNPDGCESSDDDGSGTDDDASSSDDEGKKAKDAAEKEKPLASIVDDFERLNTEMSNKLKDVLDKGFLAGYLSSLPPDDDANPANEKLEEHNEKHPQREGNLMGIYRLLIGITHHHPESKNKNYVKNVYFSCVGKLRQSITDKRNALLAKGKIREAVLSVLGDKIADTRYFSSVHEALLNKNASSVYNLQDDTQRWFDMYTPFEIRTTKSKTDETGEAFGIQPVQVKHRPLLADLLNNWPYEVGVGNKVFEPAGLLQLTRRLCIHDFSLASLMMDVSASYLKLHDLVDELKDGQQDDSVIKKKLIVFIMQTFASDRVIGKFLKTATDKLTLIPTQTKAMKNEWISIPVGNHRRPTLHDNSLFDDFTLDEIGGHYWGSRVANFSNTNHRYFAWPGAERGEYKKVSRLVQLMLNNTLVATDAKPRFISFMGTGLRNSLFLQPVLESLLLLTDRLSCVPFFDGAPVRISSDGLIYKKIEGITGGGSGEEQSNDQKSNKESVPSSGESVDGLSEPRRSETGSDNATQTEINTENAVKLKSMITIPPRAYIIHKIKLIAAMKAELQALSIRVDRASKGEFKLYGGVSWPVRTEDERQHNFNTFGPSEKIARVSGGRMVDAVELLAMDLHKQATKVSP